MYSTNTSFLLVITWFSLLFWGCVDTAETESVVAIIEEEKSVPQPVDFNLNEYINYVDSMKANGYLIGYNYVNMSWCGGGLSGYYAKDSLIFINSVYGREAGYTSQDVYWENGEIVHIVYQEYLPIWAEFEEPSKGENYFARMTYTDTIYKIDLKENWKQLKISDLDTVSNKLDTTLIERLIECSYEMKRELEQDKILIKR